MRPDSPYDPGTMKVQQHIRLAPEQLAGNADLGRYVFLPGDPSRVEKIAAHFTDVELVENPRGFTARLGRLDPTGAEPIDVLVIPSGIGTASTEVVVHELLACGARRLVRVGSCGSGAPPIRPGDVVIATGAVRDDETTRHYAPPEFPALAHPDAVAAMAEGARRTGLANRVYRGVCHSKASLFAREFGHGPAGQRNLEYDAWLRRCGVVASEMEAPALFILAATCGGGPVPLSERPAAVECQATAVLAVYASDDSDMDFDEAVVRRAEERAIRVAIEGVRVWAEQDRAGQ